jgi:hypothetical protein
MNKSKNSLEDLFGAAADDGLIGQQSQQILVEGINDTIVAGASGKAAEDVDATEVTLVTAVLDDSGSIKYSGLTDSVIQGQNALINALNGSKQSDEIMIGQWKLGSTSELVHSYVPLDDAVLFDQNNYNPGSGTALYDVWMEAVASNLAYAQTLASTGTQVTSVALVITDGQDQHSRQYLARDCAQLAKDLLASETFYLAFVGVGEKRKFQTVAEEMGFSKGSILVADATESEVRRAINLASQSIIRASQGIIQPGANSGFFGA